MKLISMLARGGMDDECLVSTDSLNLLHAEAVPLQPSPSLGGAKIHIQSVTFDFHHRIQPPARFAR